MDQKGLVFGVDPDKGVDPGILISGSCWALAKGLSACFAV